VRHTPTVRAEANLLIVLHIFINIELSLFARHTNLSPVDLLIAF